MKKLKFLQKNKLWLTSLGLVTTSSLVLAACANNTNTPPANNSGQNSNNQNNNSGTDSGTTNTTPTPEPNPSKVPVATEAQLAAAKTLLQQNTIKTVLANNKNNAIDQIKAYLLTINEVGTFSQETVAASKTALSSDDDAAVTDITDANAKAASLLGLVKTLEAQLKLSENNTAIVPANKKDQFTQAINSVKTIATTLLNKLNELPATVTADNNVLNSAKTAFETALDSYVNPTTAETLNPTWTALKKAHDDYQAKVNEVTPKLIDAQKSAFDLDQATSELDTFINTDVGAFLTDTTNGGKNTIVLNTLVTKVRTNILGNPGYDLWAKDDAPVGISVDETKKSSQLYAIVVGLANQTAAWNQINDKIKTLTFNQNLLLENKEAVNVFALHLAIPVPVDVARLNAYLTLDQSNVQKILHATTGDNIATVLETIAHGVDYFNTLLADSGDDTLVKKLTDLENAVTDNGRKAKVTALKTAAEGLVTKFTAFKKEWDKLQPALWIKKDTTITYPLLDGAVNLNQLIGLANHYGDVLQVVGQAQSLKALAKQITTAVNPIPSEANKAEKEAPLLHALQAIITDIKASTDTTFGKALADFAKESSWTTGNNKTNAEALANEKTDGSTTYEGIIYTTLVNGAAAVAKNGDTPAKPKVLSFEQLKTELEKLQNVSNKKLNDLINLLNKQLQPSDGSQTTRLNNHLAAMFNNGDVLAESEVHN
ncbi:hypothetical protein J2Z62_000416 [Mycoplasmoides fastidiosum]|uniref:Lipoprotein n=1 Tax=Mycoplasmoides fastidiosum TaxID=92758 RepID=A0ABU0LZ64_9BACT|nr:hypothetical protein [Mycoplasmoides fastidiosum]MDQ0513978.1 hypothetical protein [Mycoplasmoides fastidiosum]UUD37608.1 hypothetical protein NPA10_03510 [Mycoplasmoides fastidiosum]